MRRGRVTTGVLLWLVAAAAATAVGMTAVSAIGTDIFGGRGDPLSQSEVNEQLRSQPPVTSTPATEPTTEPTNTTAPPTNPPAGRQRTVATPGGTVTARCEPSGVRVLQAVPAQGYLVDPDDDDVDDHPSVRFSSGDREIEVRLRCVDGVPREEIEVDDD